MNNKNYQMCTSCVMDTTDPEINFDKNGVCNHCREFDEVTSKRWFPNDEGAKKLEVIYEKMIVFKDKVKFSTMKDSELI